MLSTNPFSASDLCSSLSSTSSRPRFQVVITRMASSANRMGSQPPARNLVVLAAKKVTSTSSSGAHTSAISQRDHFQRRAATTINSRVVSAMVPVTAMP